jgi:hypothetical protein
VEGEHPWEHLLPAPSGSKEHRFHRVAWAVAVTVLRSGPEAIRVADVARRAGVSRAWVYKYMGADRAALMSFAVRLFGQAFAAPATEGQAADPEAWRASIREGSRKGLADVLLAPWCVLVYVRWRHARGELGDQLRAIELAEIGRFVDRMPPSIVRDRRAAEAFATLFHAARLGILHHWLDPVFRTEVGEEAALAEIVGLIDAWLARPP